MTNPAPQSIPCDIVLLPEQALSQRAIATSASLHSLGTLYELSDAGPLPHISLYMTQLKSHDLFEVGQLLATIASQTESFTLSADRYDQAEGYIDANYVRTDTLRQLQMAVINVVNPLRDGMREKDRARLATATGVVRKNLEVYGYRGVGELFRPHLSLTRFADGTPINTKPLPRPSDFSGSFDRLAICEMGDNGTCQRVLAAFRFRFA